MDNREKIIEVKNLTVSFGKKKKRFVAVNDVSFDIYKGETFALVGESGSGKTTIARAIIRINDVESGEILYRGERINGAISKELDRKVIGNIQMVFQDPMSSLNERAKVEYIISEGLYNLYPNMKREERRDMVLKSISDVGLLPEFLDRFPHEFSGGQRQRIGLARSLVLEPEIILADEPISALDVSIRAQVINLMLELQKKKGLTYLFIAHDLSVVRFISDRVAVITGGKIVELAESEKLFEHPLHPYTKSLLSAIPEPNPRIERDRNFVGYKTENLHDKDLKWVEIEEGHWILGNDQELENYRQELAGHAHR